MKNRDFFEKTPFDPLRVFSGTNDTMYQIMWYEGSQILDHLRRELHHCPGQEEKLAVDRSGSGGAMRSQCGNLVLRKSKSFDLESDFLAISDSKFKHCHMFNAKLLF